MDGTVLTYWHSGNYDGNLAAAEVFTVWRLSWHLAGWKTVLLSEVDTRSSPGICDYGRLLRRHPTVNPKDYEYACFLRWEAYKQWMREHGVSEVLVTDNDVVNCGYTPDDWGVDRGQLPRGLDFCLLGHDQTPSIAWLNPQGADTLRGWFSHLERGDIECINGQAHVSDQTVIANRWERLGYATPEQRRDRPHLCSDLAVPIPAPLRHCSNRGCHKTGNSDKAAAMAKLFLGTR